MHVVHTERRWMNPDVHRTPDLAVSVCSFEQPKAASVGKLAQ